MRRMVPHLCLKFRQILGFPVNTAVGMAGSGSKGISNFRIGQFLDDIEHVPAVLFIARVFDRQRVALPSWRSPRAPDPSQTATRMKTSVTKLASMQTC